LQRRSRQRFSGKTPLDAQKLAHSSALPSDGEFGVPAAMPFLKPRPRCLSDCQKKSAPGTEITSHQEIPSFPIQKPGSNAPFFCEVSPVHLHCAENASPFLNTGPQREGLFLPRD